MCNKKNIIRTLIHTIIIAIIHSAGMVYCFLLTSFLYLYFVSGTDDFPNTLVFEIIHTNYTPMSEDDWEIKIDGVSEYEVFESLPYAG